MAGVTRHDRFNNDVRYAVTGTGCLVCGSNLGTCIDLGVSVHMEGPAALCEAHARDCGIYAGLSDRAEASALESSAAEELLIAGETLERATAERKAAAQDREVVERLLGQLRAETFAVTSPAEPVAGPAAKAAPRRKVRDNPQA